MRIQVADCVTGIAFHVYRERKAIASNNLADEAQRGPLARRKYEYSYDIY